LEEKELQLNNPLWWVYAFIGKKEGQKNMYTQEKFEEQLAIGSRWADFVADYLNSQGVVCEATPMKIAQTPEEIKEFTRNDKDITFKYLPGNLEVKSRSFGFSPSLNWFPQSPTFVDTVSGWSQKKEKPRAVITVSQVTKAMAVFPAETEPNWTTLTAYDKLRGYSDTFYMIDKEFMKPIGWLVEKLLKEQDELRS